MYRYGHYFVEHFDEPIHFNDPANRTSINERRSLPIQQLSQCQGSFSRRSSRGENGYKFGFDDDLEALATVPLAPSYAADRTKAMRTRSQAPDFSEQRHLRTVLMEQQAHDDQPRSLTSAHYDIHGHPQSAMASDYFHGRTTSDNSSSGWQQRRRDNSLTPTAAIDTSACLSSSCTTVNECIKWSPKNDDGRLVPTTAGRRKLPAVPVSANRKLTAPGSISATAQLQLPQPPTKRQLPVPCQRPTAPNPVDDRPLVDRKQSPLQPSNQNESDDGLSTRSSDKPANSFDGSREDHRENDPEPQQIAKESNESTSKEEGNEASRSLPVADSIIKKVDDAKEEDASALDLKKQSPTMMLASMLTGSAAVVVGTPLLAGTCAGGIWCGGESLTEHLGGPGLVRFSVQFFPLRRRLRVWIDRALGLGAGLKVGTELNVFAKTCLMPGKMQKQKSRVVRTVRDALFNEEFFFADITAKEIETKSIVIKICHIGAGHFHLPTKANLGGVTFALRDVGGLLTKKEVYLYEELRSCFNAKKLGKLKFSTMLEKDSKRLTLNILKAEHLPNFGLGGPPDPCVRIKVDQNGTVETKHTRTLRSTCNPAYNEVVMFRLSTKLHDLERMKVELFVIDTSRSKTGDDVIGRVVLGPDAKEKDEIEQWTNTLKHVGQEFTMTHHLVRP